MIDQIFVIHILNDRIRYSQNIKDNTNTFNIFIIKYLIITYIDIY